MANLVFMEQGSQPQLDAFEREMKKGQDNDERFKKGEWSDAAIVALLDAYETKWNMRNRGNLRVGDWKEVASYVSSHADGAKFAKTPTQCKNKIEGMKKRYRIEALESCSNRTACSAWPFFQRMDLLLRCPTRMAGIPGGLDAGGQPDLGFPDAVPQTESGDSDQPALRKEAMFFPAADLRQEVPFSHLQLLQGNHDLQGKALFPEEENVQEPGSNHEDASNTIPLKKESGVPDSDTSAPGSKAANLPAGGRKLNAKQRKQARNEVAASIRSFADSILKLEQAKMEMYKDTERLRAEADARRAELELRRTEVIMKAQLQIAKLLSRKTQKKKGAKGAPSNRANSSVDAALLQLTAQQMQAFGQAEAVAPQSGTFP